MWKFSTLGVMELHSHMWVHDEMFSVLYFVTFRNLDVLSLTYIIHALLYNIILITG